MWCQWISTMLERGLKDICKRIFVTQHTCGLESGTTGTSMKVRLITYGIDVCEPSAFKPRASKKFQDSTAWSYHSPTASFEDVLLFLNHLGVEEYLLLSASAKFRNKTCNVLPLCFPRSNCLPSTKNLMNICAQWGYQLLDRITKTALAVAVGVAVLVYQVSFNYPTVAVTEKLFCNHQDTIPNMQRLKIPILSLHWTEATIDRKMMCGDADSIFELVEQLDLDNKNLGDRNQNFHVMQNQKNCFSFWNRRLAAMTMYQTLPRHRLMDSRSRKCSNNTEEQKTFTTRKTLSQYDYIPQVRSFCD